ncbi:response regulator transcription factor [soil metagenome]
MSANVTQPLSKHILFLGEKNQEQQELSDHLEMENYVVHHVTKINEALSNLKLSKMEIILLDTSRNEVACLELCHVIKSSARSRKNLVILASDNHDESSEVAAFRAGADDFITKPVKHVAFVERLRTRMHEPKDSITVQSEISGHSSIHIDRESYTVYSDNTELNLSRKEFELLFLLASHPGKIFRREEVFEKVWKKKFEESNRTVDVHILRLRKKLGKDYIQTQKGVGYRFIN